MAPYKTVAPSQGPTVQFWACSFVPAANRPPDLEPCAMLSDSGSCTEHNLIGPFGFSFVWVFMNQIHCSQRIYPGVRNKEQDHYL